MSRSTNFILLAVATAAIGYFAYRQFAPSSPSGDMHGMLMPVSVAEVLSRDVRRWHDFSGRLEAVEHVEIRPRVSGVIEKVHFEDGAAVKKGDSLFTIDPRPFQATYQASNARAALAENDFKRSKKLMEDKAIAQRDYDQRENDAKVARADLARAKLDMDFTQIKSPITGRISRAEITAGNLVDAGGNAPILATVVSSDPIYVDFEIDEPTYLTFLAASNAAGSNDLTNIPVLMALTGQKDFAYKGHIQSFDNRLNPASGTLRVRALFDNPNNTLVHGMFARVRLGEASDTPALLITERAVGTDQSKKFVYVVGKEDKVERRDVVLGALTEDGMRIVTSGLSAGDKIIVNGTQRVMMPGQQVKPEIVTMAQIPVDPQQAPGAPPAAAPPEKTE